MLTDEDRAVIKEAWRQEHSLQCDAAQYAYVTGLRLGQERMRERAAIATKHWCCDCPAVIRALKVE